MNLRMNALLLALATALIAVLGDWSGSAWLATLWRLPAGLLLLGLAYESLVVRRAGLRLVIDAAAHWYLGRANRLRLRFSQQLRRPLAIEFAPAPPLPFSLDARVRTLSVPVAAAAQLDIPMTPRRLGRFAWPAQRLRVRGPLGLASWSRRLDVDYAARVAPDFTRADPRVQGLGSAGNRVGARRGTGAELLQLREYQPGDPPRAVDWKASARAHRLISRDYAEDQHLEVVIVVDAGRASGLRAGELDRFGHYVNAAVRLAQHVVTQDDLVGLVVYADQPLLALPPGRGVPSLTRIRTALADARVMGSESNPVPAALRVRSLVHHRSLVVLFTDLDDADAAGQLLGAVRLLLPKHLPFIAGLSSAAAESLAHAPAADWRAPFEALAAQEYCTGLERKVLALRAIGAPALVARPDQLDTAVLEAYASFRRRRRV